MKSQRARTRIACDVAPFAPQRLADGTQNSELRQNMVAPEPRVAAFPFWSLKTSFSESNFKLRAKP